MLRINAHFHRANLFANRDHGVDEAINLHLRLALGRLDHQRACHRKTHRRRVKTIVHQPLGNVHVADATKLFDRAHIDDAFMGDEAAVTGVEHREIRR